jgi:cyclic beta-1,2-glucan synthetase
MDAVRTFLLSRSAQVVLLLHPPFDTSAQDPGYIKGYAPGVRENGGQYTHAAVWIVMALARLGAGDEAAEVFHMLNPINHARRAAESRATGSSRTCSPATSTRIPNIAAAAVGAGTRDQQDGCIAPASRASSACARSGSTFAIDPCIPSAWPEYAITWRHLETRYEIVVTNPEGRCRGVAAATLDDAR